MNIYVKGNQELSNSKPGHYVFQACLHCSACVYLNPAKAPQNEWLRMYTCVGSA